MLPRIGGGFTAIAVAVGSRQSAVAVAVGFQQSVAAGAVWIAETAAHAVLRYDIATGELSHVPIDE